jgi:hypothetical protein
MKWVMNIKVIFIEIDGVLNTERYIRIQSLKQGGIIDSEMQFNFDPIALNNLKEIVEKTNAYLIIFSNWKNYPESRLWKEFIKNMDGIGIKEKIFDVTPKLDTYKSGNVKYEEIKEWFRRNKDKEINKFLIIDDELEMGIYTDTNFIRCWSYSGLCDDIKKNILQFFET